MSNDEKLRRQHTCMKTTDRFSLFRLSCQACNAGVPYPHPSIAEMEHEADLESSPGDLPPPIDPNPDPGNAPRVELLPPGYERRPVRRGDFTAKRRRR